MNEIALIIAAMLAGSVLIDATAQPRGAGMLAWRSPAGLWLHGLAMVAALGLILALCGNMPAAAVAVLGLLAALVMGSNTKFALLGEPLLFSDLALIGAVFRHPQFYFTALSRGQLLALAAGALAVPATMAWLFVAAAAPHLLGLALLGIALALLAVSLALLPWRALAHEPDLLADVARHGLVAILILYWRRWRGSPDPPPSCVPLAVTRDAELLVIIQCESFADPAELFDDPALALPGLGAARAAAWLSGRLLVPGFGAYTMRTEYGVMFGRDEDALGFRRYDPFLTALADASHALPARLAPAGWRSLFIHPHDLRFYGRDRILPAAGFAEMVGIDQFEPPSPPLGRYVSDAAIADKVMSRARIASGRTLIHAVTIENHGPWPVDRAGAQARVSSQYLELVARGDAMLARLQAEIAALGRPAILLFYGDHRPSIPGATSPSGPRHTPFVLLRFGRDGQIVRGTGRPIDLTPAALHHALLATLYEPGMQF